MMNFATVDFDVYVLMMIYLNLFSLRLLIVVDDDEQRLIPVFDELEERDKNNRFFL